MAIAELAARQHGVVSRRQLLAAGLTANAITRRIALRRLLPLHAGVYAVGHHPPLHGRYLAATLACGDQAVLSHRAAAALWELRPTASGLIDVTVPRRGGRGRPAIRIHAARSLAPADTTIRHEIPCTTPARTLLDLATIVPPRQLERALERSLIVRVFDRAAFDGVLARANGHRGAGTLRRALDDLADEPPPTRNDLERDFLDLVRVAGLPEPVVNGIVEGHEVDFHWPAQRLIVETDGRATHDTAIAFERDRQRDLELELAGWHVIRISWRQLAREPGRVAALLRSTHRRSSAAD